MYNTAYNRAIANEVNRINKRFIKHNKDIENMSGSGVSGGGVSGGKEYIKNQPDICRHCEGSGISGGSIPQKRRVGRPRKHKEHEQEMNGKGGVGLNLPFGGFNVGWGHPEPEKLKGKGGFGLNLPFGGFNVGWGKPKSKNLEGEGGISLNLPFGGFNVGWGKKTKNTEQKPKRHNPRAEIVKKVMKEQGLSMIEASKYVKQNNLY